jgi:hypothetical protein
MSQLTVTLHESGQHVAIIIVERQERAWYRRLIYRGVYYYSYQEKRYDEPPQAVEGSPLTNELLARELRFYYEWLVEYGSDVHQRSYDALRDIAERRGLIVDEDRLLDGEEVIEADL